MFTGTNDPAPSGAVRRSPTRTTRSALPADGYHLDDLCRATGGGGHQLEGLPGPRRQLQRQLAGRLPAVPRAVLQRHPVAAGAERGLSTTLTSASLDGLRNDVLAGALPQVSWIVAPAAYSEHPGPSSPVQGGWYTQQVLEALTANPDVWSKTVLLVMFDENDGYFDHVPPPCAPSLNPRPARSPAPAPSTTPPSATPTATSTARARACRCRGLAMEPGRLGRLARRSTTPRSSASSRSASACRSRTSARGDARCSAI